MRTRRTPLRVQLALGFCVLLSALFLLAFLAVYQDTRSSLYQNLDRDLLSLARTEISSAIDVPNQGPHFHSQTGSHQGVLFQPDGLILAATPGLPPEEAASMVKLAVATPSGVTFRTVQAYRVITMEAPLPGLPRARLVMRMPLQPVWQNLRDVQLTLAWWGILSTLVGSFVAWPLAARLTRPLERVAGLAERVIGGQKGERLSLSGESSEVHLLQSSLNQMLDELELRAAQQRQFVADASHELRNPLHALLGTLEVTRRRPRSPQEYEEAMDVALVETRRLSRLVEDLLVLSRADLARLELRRERVDLLQLLHACGQAHSARADELGVKLQVEGESRWAQLDSTRIRQVLDNLVDNALRHSPRGGTVRLCLVGHSQVEVLDEGESLEAEEYERIFGRFTRLDDSRQRHSGGLGLGLAIARGLVEAHGGQLRAEARTEGGSRFFFNL